jgi:hypothetical protein
MSKKVTPKKKLARDAVNQAIGLANANSGKLKSVKIKIKFDGGKSPNKKRRATGKARGGY